MGPRNAERVDAALQAGTLHGELHGSVDLKHAAAEIDYSLDTADMAPRPGVDWRRLALTGSWHGSVSAPRADGTLTVDDLRLTGGARVARLSAELAAPPTLCSTCASMPTPRCWMRKRCGRRWI
jgi:hypothetical protein